MVKPLSRIGYMGIVAGLTLYGTAVFGMIGTGAGALIDGGRAVYSNYAEREQMTKNKDNFKFTSIGSQVFGGLGAIVFGFAGVVTASTAKVISQSKRKVE
jgi:hypothetical protein